MRLQSKITSSSESCRDLKKLGSRPKEIKEAAAIENVLLLIISGHIVL